MYLNQIIDRRHLTNNKLIKIVRPILIELNGKRQLKEIKELTDKIENKQNSKIIKFNK